MRSTRQLLGNRRHDLDGSAGHAGRRLPDANDHLLQIGRHVVQMTAKHNQRITLVEVIRLQLQALVEITPPTAVANSL